MAASWIPGRYCRHDLLRLLRSRWRRRCEFLRDDLLLPTLPRIAMILSYVSPSELSPALKFPKPETTWSSHFATSSSSSSSLELDPDSIFNVSCGEMRCDKKLYLSLSRSRFFSPLSGLWDVQSPNGRISVAAQARESNVGESSSRKQQGKQFEKYSLCCSTGNSGSWRIISWKLQSSILGARVCSVERFVECN